MSLCGDRVLKQLFPHLSSISLIARHPETLALILQILRNVTGKNASRLVRAAALNVIELSGRALSREVAVQLLMGLAELDKDQMWFLLVAQCSSATMLNHPGGELPSIDLRPLRVKG